ncbi:Broad specificity phosphatase PhoE [Gemmobacter megaterium]|uniref:Broad specificity phosphatase PhoE n=1 Tax=Gemmobacter megaterium TaxID=1086013 RepID=A0A1N7KU73_9RHOB|nr:histidine phosphatase family protein [Gemmobacter megaterium]GGE03847.1 phosphoglycerate mutase [Gemmobacter megaterium]SIS65115.1 Broad specificity phosphatase PhoE [Gemmobacter megaterium]
MTRFYWLRHGPTHQKVFTGWRDVPADLSDTALIARMAAQLPQDAPVVSSDLRRARDTADALCGPRMRLPDMPGLRELHFGDWDGLAFSQIEARDPELSRAYWETPGDIAPPGGESWNETSDRVERCVQALAAANPGRPVIIVAHLGVILTQIARTSGHTIASAIGLYVEPLSLTEIQFDGSDRHLIRTNHLA